MQSAFERAVTNETAQAQRASVRERVGGVCRFWRFALNPIDLRWLFLNLVFVILLLFNNYSKRIEDFLCVTLCF